MNLSEKAVHAGLLGDAEAEGKVREYIDTREEEE